MSVDLQFIKGIGPKRAAVLLRELEIATWEDALEYFPFRYVDRSKVYKINEIVADMNYIQLVGRFMSREVVGVGTKRRLTAKFTDGTGVIEVVWFNNIDGMASALNGTDEYLLFGKAVVYGGRLSMTHPEMTRTPDMQKLTGTLQPIYNTTEQMKRIGLNSRGMQKIIEAVFNSILPNEIRETLPSWLVEKHNLMRRRDAIRVAHFPHTMAELEQARFRLKFEELFYVQLSLLRNKNINRRSVVGIRLTSAGTHLNEFYKNHLRFEPTGAQKRVVHEIWNDMRSGQQMNRLVQGDVGSGKTLVALMSMLIVSGNGMQACLMAPTEILATQHYNGLQSELCGMGIRMALLTGSTKTKERRNILSGLADGSIQIVVGTHALIEPTVTFHNLALAVIDEQHRFGVQQRAMLWSKNTCPPHILVMTATPIPRTLAMTIYGDLDVSVIDKMPPGRIPVTTEHYFHNNRNRLNAFVRRQLQEGRQAYVVYPLIEESERLDYKNLQQGFEYMCNAFPDYNVCMVHGKLKPAEKDEAMQRFVSGLAQIMVATTVIEVGVNVPNATVMIIESAERFGLSQLHQLRGRVGRGAAQSYCILMTDSALSRDSRRRIETMCLTTDGFEIAEADLRLRGPGDLEGTAQSGLPFKLKISNLARDSEIINFARSCAEEILKIDPTLSHPDSVVMSEQLRRLAANKQDWSQIS